MFGWGRPNYSEFPLDVRQSIVVTRPKRLNSFACSDGRPPVNFWDNLAKVLGGGDGLVAAISHLKGISPDESLNYVYSMFNGYRHLGHGDDHGGHDGVNPKGCGARVLISEKPQVLGLRPNAVSEVETAYGRLNEIYCVSGSHDEVAGVINDLDGYVIDTRQTPFQVFVFDRWAVRQANRNLRVSGLPEFMEDMYKKGVEALKPGTPIRKFRGW